MDANQKRKGFTLLEILLYAGIAAVILSTASFFFILMLKSRVENQTAAEVEQQGIQMMQIITQTARNAQGINSPAAGASAGSLSLALADSAKNPTVFDISASILRIKEGSDPVVVLNSPNVTVTNLTFTNLSRTGTKGTVRIQFTLAHINPGAREEYEYAKTFYGSASLR